MQVTLTPVVFSTIANELNWIKDNIFTSKDNEYDYIYSRIFKGLHTPNLSSFISSIVVAFTSKQLQESLCYRNIVSEVANVQNFSSKFTNFCNTHKVMLAIVGPHAPFVHLPTNDNDMFKSLIDVYENYTLAANCYKLHIGELEKLSGYKINIIWPNELNNEHAVDIFLRKTKFL